MAIDEAAAGQGGGASSPQDGSRTASDRSSAGRAASAAPADTSPSADAPQIDSAPTSRVTHRRYVPYSHAHYAGNLVDGAYVLALFGDVATELCIRLDGDEGLFASYSSVQFLAPVRGGDVIEVTATLVRRGRRSRVIDFRAHVVSRGRPDQAAGAAEVLAEPLAVTTARGTVVVPA